MLSILAREALESSCALAAITHWNLSNFGRLGIRLRLLFRNVAHTRRLSGGTGCICSSPPNSKGKKVYDDLIHADILHLPLHLEKIECVTLFDVIEHLSKNDGRKLLGSLSHQFLSALQTLIYQTKSTLDFWETPLRIMSRHGLRKSLRTWGTRQVPELRLFGCLFLITRAPCLLTDYGRTRPVNGLLSRTDTTCAMTATTSSANIRCVQRPGGNESIRSRYV